MFRRAICYTLIGVALYFAMAYLDIGAEMFTEHYEFLGSLSIESGMEALKGDLMAKVLLIAMRILNCSVWSALIVIVSTVVFLVIIVVAAIIMSLHQFFDEIERLRRLESASVLAETSAIHKTSL